MTRRKAPLQVNKLSGGFVTELNPLETSLETTEDEINMVINRNGSRKKRLGFSYENDRELIDSGVVYDASSTLGHSVFRWENAGGVADKNLKVVQVAGSMKIFDLDNEPISSEVIYSRDFGPGFYTNVFSYANVDGLLVVVNGNKPVYVYDYDGNTNTVTESTTTLYIRDLFGVQAFRNSLDVTLSQNLEHRPTTNQVGNEHLYNLRNQGWNRARRNANGESIVDPIGAFRSDSGFTIWPANSDLINNEVYADPNDGDNRLVERFFAQNLIDTRSGSFPPPKGYFIIDALERGASRLEQDAALHDREPELNFEVSNLPTDRTPGGASAITEHAGRVWYGGFSGIVEGGDSKSPRMSSYVLFSVLVKDRTDVGRCYQEADPTDKDDSALGDTDGGFIRLDGAYGIKSMVSIRGSLFVFCENGVWRITGSSESSFTATSYETNKVTDRGCISGTSVVVQEDKVFYWNNESIFVIARNEFGEWAVESLTESTINSFYLDILNEDKKTSKGSYDAASKQIKWLYNRLSSGGGSYELIFDVVFNAWTKNYIPPESGDFPKVINLTSTNPFSVINSNFDVYDNSGALVTVQGVTPVFVTRTIRTGTSSSSVYLVIDNTSGTIEYSFGLYGNTSLYDWDSTNYEAYLITNPLSAGEPRSQKQTPYVHTFFKRTEDGFDDLLNPTRPSSCLLSSRWSWADSIASKKWSTERQAYRYSGVYIPANSDDDYDTGFDVISTRNKIRGIGESVSFKFNAEAGKDMHLLGYAFNLTASNED